MDALTLKLAKNYTDKKNKSSIPKINATDFSSMEEAISNLREIININGKGELYFPASHTYMTDGIVISNLSNFVISGPGTLKLNRA